jgi:hypothetical protein
MPPEPSSPASQSQQDDALPMPLGGTRAEAMKRLQIGLLGLAAMLLMVALANIVMERAKQTDAAVVPEAVDAAASDDATTLKDPLVDAGVVPELPSQGGQPAPGGSGK